MVILVSGGIVTFFFRGILISIAVTMAVAVVPANAELASVEYVSGIVAALQKDTSPQADWKQTDSTAPDFIKNKPEFPDVSEMERVSNRVTEVTSASTDAQYPSARAVNNAIETRAPADDVRFNTISTTRPTGTPPAGQVFIWFE